MINLTKNQYYEITIEEHNANAHLIAAAPDIFEHLLYAIECVSCAIVPNSQWLERANAAIKKARGDKWPCSKKQGVKNESPKP